MTDAQKIYAKRRREIQALLEWIGQEIEEDWSSTGEPVLWDLVGTLDLVRDRLIEGLDFLTGFGREDIEVALQATSRNKDKDA